MSRQCVITEKIDGTNAGIYIGEGGEFLVASRTRWITPQDDNYGFAKWAYDNKEELMKLGPGMHHGEWWGRGIQRHYNKTDRTFSLFNANRWTRESAPACCSVVPVLYMGLFYEQESLQGVRECINMLRINGSYAAPGFMKPEGIVIFIDNAKQTMFKMTLEKDESPKGI
jgi:hypothetical protein